MSSFLLDEQAFQIKAKILTTKNKQSNDDQSMCQACAHFICKIEEMKKLLRAT